MAIYQAIYPESVAGTRAVVQPLNAVIGTFTRPIVSTENIDTPLAPFTHATGQGFTSQDVSSAKSIYTLGYAYPETPSEYQSRSDADLSDFARKAVDDLYAPAPAELDKTASTVAEAPASLTNATAVTLPTTQPGVKKRVEWLATITFDESEIDGSFTVWVYIGDAPAGSGEQFLISKNLVDGCSSFSNKMKARSVISGTVPLTKALTVKGVTLNPRSAATYLKDNFHWRVMKGTEQVDITKLPSLKVQVNAADVEYYDDPSKLPVYGEWKTYYEPTAAKRGGSDYSRKIRLLAKEVVAVNSTTLVAV